MHQILDNFQYAQILNKYCKSNFGQRILIIFTPVQQGGAVQRLTEALREKEAAASELSLLIQELQVLRHNLTALRGRTWRSTDERFSKLDWKIFPSWNLAWRHCQDKWVTAEFVLSVSYIYFKNLNQTK